MPDCRNTRYRQDRTLTWGVPQDYVQAYVWLKLAAAQGNKNAGDRKDSLKQQMTPQQLAEGRELASELIRNKLHNQEFQIWVSRLHKQAESRGYESPLAQSELGVLYAQGVGVPRDFEKAVTWFRKAADQGNAKAQCFLAVMCYLGLGVQPDAWQSNYLEAARWFRKMAKQDKSEWYFLAAILGDAEAQYTQGVTESDHEEALEWFRNAAEQGHPGAQYELGRRSGGCQAKAWFAKAAEQGHAGAQYELGCMYHQGREVPKDYGQALTWYLKADTQGHAGAHYSLGLMHAAGHGVSQDDREAAMSFRKAADQGHAQAQFLLSRSYEHGRGVRQNPVHAYAWITLAAKASPGSYADTLLRLENSMTPVELTDAQHLAADYAQRIAAGLTTRRTPKKKKAVW